MWLILCYYRAMKEITPEVTPPAHTSSRRDFWLIVCAALSWGTVGVANQAIYAHVATNAISLAFFRLIIAAPLFILASILLPGRRILRVKPRDLTLMILMGAMQALYQASYSAAIALAGVTVPTLIALCGAPVIVALLSAPLMHERLHRLTFVALLCALGGTFLLVAAHPVVGGVSLISVFFSLLAASGYASFVICGRLLTGLYHPLHINSVAFGAGALFLLFLALPTGLTLAYPLWAWLLLLYLGCIPTALASPTAWLFPPRTRCCWWSRCSTSMRGACRTRERCRAQSW